MDVQWASAAELSGAYRTGHLSPVEVTTALLDRIHALDAKTNAFCLVDETRALDQARASEARYQKGEPRDALDGVPVGIKDLLITKGWPTLRGSHTVDPKGPWEEDAPAVARLLEAGAVLIGKTTTPEFGWKGVTDNALNGITRNPWNLGTTPGGSSGGSSAALAAGFVPLATGTDGGGSIRIPAAFAGVAGLKPSFGRVPAYPLSPFGTVAHVGPMARTVRDLALFLSVIARPDARDWYHLPDGDRDWTQGLDEGVKGLRLAVSADLGYARVDPEVRAAFDAAVLVLEGLGAHVDRVDPPFDDPVETFRVLWWSGANFLLGELPDEQFAKLDPGLQSVVERGAKFSRRDYHNAIKAREQLGSDMRGFMRAYDGLLTPSLAVPAFEVGTNAPGEPPFGDWEPWTPFSYPFNLTQQPAASVPCGFTQKGLPVGLQIVGPMFDDGRVLRIAQAYEQATGWHTRHPDL